MIRCVLATAECLSAISATVCRLLISALVFLEGSHALPQNEVGLENNNFHIAIHLRILNSKAITSIVGLLIGSLSQCPLLLVLLSASSYTSMVARGRCRKCMAQRLQQL